jgi:tRNA threonylcarbamoyladenosine biosynthesis protein TsaE
MDRIISTLDELQTEAEALVARLTSKPEGATLITLSGELGAGKTAFTKAIAKALGIEDHITSPTFVLEKIYLLLEKSPFKRLAHIDAYRLKNGEDLAALGFDELMSDAGTLVMLEWPEQVQDALPKADVRIKLEALVDNARKITYA